MKQFNIGKKGILLDLGGGAELIQIELKAVEGSTYFDGDLLSTKRTILECAAPVFRIAKSGRRTVFINAGDTHTLVIIQGENDPTWNGWREFKNNVADTILDRTGMSIVSAISAGGGTWIELHCYPKELYVLDKYELDGEEKIYVTRPLIKT